MPAPEPRQQPPDRSDEAWVHAAIEESRQFLAQFRAAYRKPRDPDELQVRIMRRGGCPTEEHYARLFRAEGMAPPDAAAEARRMVAADRELLARHPARP